MHQTLLISETAVVKSLNSVTGTLARRISNGMSSGMKGQDATITLSNYNGTSATVLSATNEIE